MASVDDPLAIDLNRILAIPENSWREHYDAAHSFVRDAERLDPKEGASLARRLVALASDLAARHPRRDSCWCAAQRRACVNCCRPARVILSLVTNVLKRPAAFDVDDVAWLLEDALRVKAVRYELPHLDPLVAQRSRDRVGFAMIRASARRFESSANGCGVRATRPDTSSRASLSA